jgi:hypothetical protein
MNRGTLREKLRQAGTDHPEAAWNLRRWPTGWGRPRRRHLFVALDGAWRGYFRLEDVCLFNEKDQAVPYTLLFDTRTWTPIEAIPVKRFRGFTFEVPEDVLPRRRASRRRVPPPSPEDK